MNYNFLSETPLFQGIKVAEIKHILNCLNAKEKSFKKNEIIFNAGDIVNEIGMVLSGGVNIVVNFYWGNSQILGHIDKGFIFAENYAAIPEKELIVDVVAIDYSEILFINLKKLLITCKNQCGYHQQLIYNLLKISAQKSINLSGRMIHIAPRTIRERVLSYLSEQAILHSDSKFKIPFNRQQLADYLAVDRSALSNELSKMQSEGLIEFKKNSFSLKK